MLASARMMLAPEAEALAANQTFGDAAGYDGLEQAAKEITVAEAAVAVLREGRMVGDRVRQVEPAKPAIGEVEMNLLAQPPLRADAHDVADEQHAEHQLRVDRRPADGAVEGQKIAADV